MSPTTQQLAEWEALAAEATPGPWRTHTDRVDVVLAGEHGMAICGTVFHDDLFQEQADSRFIAAAREGWPATIAALRMSRAQVGALDRQLNVNRAQLDVLARSPTKFRPRK